MSAKHVIVHGSVQGVFFRGNAEQAASELGLGGWVRNRDDGTVEMHVEGEDSAVSQMVQWARSGPEQAEVIDVQVTDVEPEGHQGFSQL